jgi:hypothetical protein
MPHTIGAIAAHTSSTSNPITFSHTVNAGETVLVVMLSVVGASDRTGGALTFGSQTFSQANSTQKAAATPESSAEIWYLVNPTVTTATLTIPNAAGLTVWRLVVAAKAPAGGGSVFSTATGTNNTAANPAVTVTLPGEGNIIFAVVASGAQTWAPSARDGTQISDTDNGTIGDGFQYLIRQTSGSQTMGWTFGTSEDYGLVAVAFSERPAHGFNNYFGVSAGSGMSVTEKIR